MIRISDIKTGFNAMIEHARPVQEAVQGAAHRQEQISQTALEQNRQKAQSVNAVSPYQDENSAGKVDPESGRSRQSFSREQSRKEANDPAPGLTESGKKTADRLYPYSGEDPEDKKGKNINYIIM